ncbi:MAG TPA: phosphate acyltransferase PlsX [Thermotogota bacterium]|nr:phosphate acyltransferase PlsX [Thermotogota bacterium]HRW91685.1 phosphate acyltransferase PlsX [Thermotogota bacterium]
MITIAVDAMGGDHAPRCVVDGCLQALSKGSSDWNIVLVGRKEKLEPLLPTSSRERMFVEDAPDLFGMDEKPSSVLKRKETSLFRAAQLVKEGKAHALLSAGNTGGLLAVATFVVGRIPNIPRPAICTSIPSPTGPVFLIDSGANLECKPEHFLGFANLGVALYQDLFDKQPRIAILNVGTEEDKGTELVKEAFQVLSKEFSGLFGGFAEGRDITSGTFQLVLTDGWSGNIALKTMEGVSRFILDALKEEVKQAGIFAKLGALLMKPVFHALKKRLDPRQTGGAFILGVNAPVVKAHGNSDAFAIQNALQIALSGVRNGLVEKTQKLAQRSGSNA